MTSITSVPLPANSPAIEIRCASADDFERDVSPLLGAHHLRLLGRASQQPFQMRHKALPRLSVSTISYGRAVGVDVLAARSHWSVSQVSAGRVVMGHSAAAQTLNRGAWTVYAPDCDDALAFNETGAVQTLVLPLASVNSALCALLGHDIASPAQLTPGPIAQMHLRQRLAQLAARLWTLDDAATGPLARVRSLQEELALYELLLTVPHNYSDALHQVKTPQGSQAVQRARDFLHAQVQPGSHKEVTLHDVATHAGLGVRALGSAFVRETGVSPMRYLRQLRLDQARLDLISGNCTVTDAATRWGFWNLGDFARYYQQRHGELPSAAASVHRRPVRFLDDSAAETR
jgi:AraC-like DNA-binding protein